MKFWYTNSKLAWLLLPFSGLFWLITLIRRFCYQWGWLKSYQSPVPVIIVGNLSVGGNGKTPVTIWLVQQLQQRGFKVGVISRGYGSQAKIYPLLVSANTDPVIGGDEPVLIAHRTQVPVCISPNRQQAIELLLQTQACDFIVADDGLQHYSLQRSLEIVVMDAKRGLGNGFLLPAGPLRELASRLQKVDLIITNGGENQYSELLMELEPEYAVNLCSGEQRLLTEFQDMPINAMAGIGNPQRFFTMLQQLGIPLSQTQAFQDHQKFDEVSLGKFSHQQPLFMTEKDAVKCQAFACPNWWYVPVEAKMKPIQQIKWNEFWQKIDKLSQQEQK